MVRFRIVFSIIMLTTAFLAGAGDIDDKFVELGFVDVGKADTTLVVDLRYATPHNFVGKNMYGSLRRAYLTPETARSLIDAQRRLRKIDKRYSIVIYDAGRPVSVQRVMWDMVKGTPNSRYVAQPYKGGPHNYGVAVDVGMLYNGKEIDMGTGFDTFTEASHITNEAQLVKRGVITTQAMRNRMLLRRVMTEAGFMTYRREWWHFERHRVAYARRNLPMLDF